MFKSNVGLKTGVFSPVTGQAVVVQSTCADDTHADEINREYNNDQAGRFKLPKKDLPRRVESHLLALKKKRRSRYVKGSGADLKIFTMLNGMKRDEVLSTLSHVGIVQTPINPNDGTKPQVTFHFFWFCIFYDCFLFWVFECRAFARMLRGSVAPPA